MCLLNVTGSAAGAGLVKRPRKVIAEARGAGFMGLWGLDGETEKGKEGEKSCLADTEYLGMGGGGFGKIGVCPNRAGNLSVQPRAGGDAS
jgi:hypothetical protein